MTRLPYGRQTIDEEDIQSVVEALRAPLLTCGPLVAQFEQALATVTGAPYAVACSSGTAALHLAYAALGIGPGDEIITTPITFSATAAAAYYVGASVRIADVDPRTGNLDPRSVESLMTSRTRAIVPVHLAGLPADLDELRMLARSRDVLLVEDACHALGATYHGTPIGAGTSDAVVFSFHPVKHVTTGEGGAVIVRNPAVQQRIMRMRHHGIERDPATAAYAVTELGWNYRLPDFACALGISQLAKLDRFLAARRELASLYREALTAAFPDGGVLPPVELSDRVSAYHLYAVAIDFERFATTRDDVMRALAVAGVGTQVHYIPLLQHPLHAQRCPDELRRSRPGADAYFAHTLSLPLFPAMTAADVTFVVDELRRVLGGSR